jgi:hypothetical protein
MQEEIRNSNAMDDMFVAFTVVRQFLTGLRQKRKKFQLTL